MFTYVFSGCMYTVRVTAVREGEKQRERGRKRDRERYTMVFPLTKTLSLMNQGPICSATKYSHTAKGYDLNFKRMQT